MSLMLCRIAMLPNLRVLLRTLAAQECQDAFRMLCVMLRRRDFLCCYADEFDGRLTLPDLVEGGDPDLGGLRKGELEETLAIDALSGIVEEYCNNPLVSKISTSSKLQKIVKHAKTFVEFCDSGVASPKAPKPQPQPIATELIDDLAANAAVNMKSTSRRVFQLAIHEEESSSEDFDASADELEHGKPTVTSGETLLRWFGHARAQRLASRRRARRYRAGDAAGDGGWAGGVARGGGGGEGGARPQEGQAEPQAGAGGGEAQGLAARPRTQASTGS